MKTPSAILASVALLFSVPAVGAGNGHSHGHDKPAAAAASDMVDGQIKRINKGTGKLTIKHGPIKSMDMPPMTMVFVVKDPAMLENIAKGDNVRFTVREADGQMMIDQLQKQ